MYHFVALLWNSDDPAARHQAAELERKLRHLGKAWKPALSFSGISVLTLRPSDPALRVYVCPGHTGVVLGRLFRRDRFVDQRAAFEVAGTPTGSQLIRNSWGAYVAIMRDPQTRAALAIRDCSGQQPCYYTREGDVTIVFADIADLAPLGLPTFTVNWEYLAAFIYSSQMQVRACAFNEIQEVLAGECLEVSGGTVHQKLLWDPREICRERRIDRYEDAVVELRAVTERCIDAWAQSEEPILHSLSGGFDSAVVLGCLSQSRPPQDITCLTQYTSASHDDERGYATAAAELAGVALREVPMSSGAAGFDSRLLSGPRMAKPSVAGLFRLLEADLINGIAEATGARRLWTGQGGDHLFLQMADASTAADYLAMQGLRLGFVQAVRDAAHLSRQPYWWVLKSALKAQGHRRRGPAAQRHSLSTHFVNPERLPEDSDTYVSHPWTHDAEDLPPGKRMQIRFLAEVIHRHRPLPRLERAPQHHPLLSQPLIEVCLQIPTYLLIRGGRERGLAREAFADRLPHQILRRRDKGSIVSHATEMVRGSEGFVRDLLLDGVLAGSGMIRPEELKPFIVDGQPFRENHFLPLLACIAAEAWVRKAQGETG